ncbi:hypothetical protein D3C77_435740 [compost metagenome]
MVELAVQFLLVADLRPGQPLGTQAVDTVHPVAGTDIEGAVAAHVIGQVQTQSQVVSTSTAPTGIDYQGVVIAFVHNPILHTVEVVQAIEGAHVGLQAP